METPVHKMSEYCLSVFLGINEPLVEQIVKDAEFTLDKKEFKDDAIHPGYD